MKYINLGGLGGCRITFGLNECGLRTESYPFDWNMATQQFVLNYYYNNKFFIFEDQYVVSPKYLVSPENDAFLCHDFDNDWDIKKEDIILKYTRRLNRFRDVINSDEKIIFCRDCVDKVEHRNFITMECLPNFNILEDSIIKWEYFINTINANRSIPCKLLLFTSDKSINSYNDNIIITYLNKCENPDDEYELMKNIYLSMKN